MTLLDVRELCDYWAEHPPVHILVAAFVGYKAEAKPASPGWRDVLAEGPPNAEVGPDWRMPFAGMEGFEPGRLPENMNVPLVDFAELMRMN